MLGSARAFSVDIGAQLDSLFGVLVPLGEFPHVALTASEGSLSKLHPTKAYAKKTCAAASVARRRREACEVAYATLAASQAFQRKHTHGSIFPLFRCKQFFVHARKDWRAAYRWVP